MGIEVQSLLVVGCPIDEGKTKKLIKKLVTEDEVLRKYLVEHYAWPVEENESDEEYESDEDSQGDNEGGDKCYFDALLEGLLGFLELTKGVKNLLVKEECKSHEGVQIYHLSIDGDYMFTPSALYDHFMEQTQRSSWEIAQRYFAVGDYDSIEVYDILQWS